MTCRLWEDTNPQEMVWISAAAVTEEQLREKGVEYSEENRREFKGFLVEKSQCDKLKDYHLRLLGTPVTLAIDAAVTVTVVGVIVCLENPELIGFLLKAPR
jgi:hypothetical protein